MTKTNNLPNWLYGVGAIAGTIYNLASIFLITYQQQVVTSTFVDINQDGRRIYYRLPITTTVDYLQPYQKFSLLFMVSLVILAILFAWKSPSPGGEIIFFGVPFVWIVPITAITTNWNESLPLVLDMVLITCTPVIIGIFFIFFGLATRKDKKTVPSSQS